MIDLELRIFRLEDHTYPVELTLAGQQEFPRGFLDDSILSWTAGDDPVADGRRLFEALLADPQLRVAWAEARGQAPQRRLRLRIDPAAAELHTLPWELLHEDAVMLSANAATPFSRYLPVALPWGGEVEDRPIRVLVAISNPTDLQSRYNLAQLDAAQERATLEAALEDIAGSDVEMTFLDPPVTPEAIEAALRDGYHALHYLGHGAFNPRRGQAALYLQDATGAAQIVTDDAFIGMLARQAVHPRLVFLAACQSATRDSADAFRGLGPKLVAAGVPAVVAMQDVVSVETARKLGATFYGRLAEHGAVDLALNEARSTLLTAGRPDAVVPVLFMRLKSGRLWGDEADARGEVLGARNLRGFWAALLSNIEEKTCLPIIGPRVHGRWLPTPDEVARRWSGTHGYPFDDTGNLARVAQYLASSQGEDFPRREWQRTLIADLTARLPEELRPRVKPKTLTELVQSAGWQALTAGDPNEVHRVLASLDLPLYLTSNGDSFMVQALAAQGKQPTRELCRWHMAMDDLPSRFDEATAYHPTPEAPMVYHLLGADHELASLVLAEDHYLDFLIKISAERDRIPDYLRGALASSALMFVGFSLADWEFRVIMRGLVAPITQRLKIKHVAVQVEQVEETRAETVRAFLEAYFEDADINVYWGSPAQFIAELREQWAGRE
ncbi:MAG: CHAT domain-containing protein [Anaerolineae bacterium]|nr:CHAT domain-containing protein [Anaerolineae bacterium]